MKSADDYIMTFVREAYGKLMKAYGFEGVSLKETIEFAQSVVANVSSENLDEAVVVGEISPELRAEKFAVSFVDTWRNILESDIRVSIEKAAELLVEEWSRVSVR